MDMRFVQPSMHVATLMDDEDNALALWRFLSMACTTWKRFAV